MTVTDTSNRTATSPTLTINTFNYSPFTSWKSGNNQTVTGTFTVDAVANPHLFGTANIKKWCLTVDGSPVASDVAVERYYSDDVGYAGTFNAETGCWSNSTTSLNAANFSFRTAAWTNASRVLKIVVTDTSNRTATDSLTFTTNNPQPTTRVIGLTAGETIDKVETFAFKVYHPGANSIASWCIHIKTTSCSSNVSVSTSGATSIGTVSFDTSLWRNGSYRARFTATDSEGRSFNSGSISFKSKNPGASASKPRIENGNPVWSDKTVDVEITTTSKNATKLFLYLGTSKTQLWKYAISPTDPSELFSLKPKTVYYVKVEAEGPNGSSETEFTTFTSASLPPKPAPPSGGGGGGGGGSSGGCYAGMNWDSCISRLGYEPYSYDCTGYGRGVWWASNWWILFFSGGVPVLSKSAYYCD